MGRPVPAFSEDEVLDFQVAEALQKRIEALRKEQREEDESKQRRRGHRDMAQYAGGAG